ncbi:MAG TPA: CpsD/CapB family tyrosine-protein kinase, partial [Tepidisphaeraceae bacterium]|nr:CpsD/CapB family tyrosine-protein kinase [Tepidisphaeraceae bacterium]
LQLRGFGEMHPDMLNLRIRIQSAKQRVAKYAEEYQEVQQATGRGTGELGIGPALINKTPAQLKAEEAKLVAMRDDARHEMVELESDHVQQIRRDADLRRDSEALDLTNRKIDQLMDMDQMGGRLTVISAGETPLSPAVDRRVKFAGAGAMAGAMAPFGLVALFGILRRRYRYADETVADISPRAPLLGILPALDPRDLSDDQAALAAQSVHRIRVLLQVGRPARQSVAYMVSSATASEGKTSLAMSLGLSFAAAGSRTLVIDGDLVGQQLTRGIEAGDTPGLLEALRAGTLQGCLRRTMAGLYVLPVGNADVQDACSVSPTAFRRLLDQARSHFDSILIDSGPILGSVEASLVAQLVDGVILAVARGQEPSLVQRAMGQLKSLGAQISGFVFNRARSVDFRESQYASSRSRTAVAPNQRHGTSLGQCRLGPLVSAVASSLPSAFQTSMS